ncbi:hypothetical protein BJY04DRAFT_196373 [Aspergillus karnatakaensis]|uniref:uncharacterized protein n=1 Tax=Aspergillus karnatakaensis TaxID=1810916 RepID=UPI003CCD5106
MTFIPPMFLDLILAISFCPLLSWLSESHTGLNFVCYSYHSTVRTTLSHFFCFLHTMTWSKEEIIAFVTMCITIPTFILAILGIVSCYRRRRKKTSGQSRAEHPGELSLLSFHHSPVPSSTSPTDDGRDIESGCVWYKHVTTSTISRSETVHIGQGAVHEL